MITKIILFIKICLCTNKSCDKLIIYEHTVICIDRFLFILDGGEYEMVTTNEYESLGDLFKIFSNSTRLQILLTLADGEKCVFDICDTLNMTQSAISHQLSILKSNRLVKNRRDGKTIYYSLLDSHVLTIIQQGLDHIRE